MPALTVKESARYSVRLFGYLLATTLFGGVFVGAGAGLAYYLEPAFFAQLTGTAATNLTALAVFGVLSAIGVLVVLTGLFVVGFVAVTDAVRIGANRSALTEPVDFSRDSTEESSDDPAESVGEKSASEESTTESVPEVQPDAGSNEISDEPAPVDRATSNESGSVAVPDDSGGVEADPGGDAYDPTDPIDDPHEAQTNPFDEPSSQEPSTAEEWTSKTPPDRNPDDEAWRQEIEAKLEGDEKTESS